MFDSILSRINTRQEAEFLTAEIDILLEGLYQNKGLGFESILRSKIRSWVSELLEEEFAKQKQDREKYLKGLKEEILKLIPFKLILAFEPSRDALDRFASFVKREVGKNVILDITFDPHIIGGAVLIYKGNYRDFSFKKEFERVLGEMKGEILSHLTNLGNP